jgi:hypothetical protein
VIFVWGFWAYLFSGRFDVQIFTRSNRIFWSKSTSKVIWDFNSIKEWKKLLNVKSYYVNILHLYWIYNKIKKFHESMRVETEAVGFVLQNFVCYCKSQSVLYIYNTKFIFYILLINQWMILPCFLNIWFENVLFPHRICFVRCG